MRWAVFVAMAVLSTSTTAIPDEQPEEATLCDAGSDCASESQAAGQDLTSVLQVSVSLDRKRGHSATSPEADTQESSDEKTPPETPVVHKVNEMPETLDEPEETLGESSHRMYMKAKKSVSHLITQAQTGTSFLPWALALVVISCVICGVIYIQLPEERRVTQHHPNVTVRDWVSPAGLRRGGYQDGSRVNLGQPTRIIERLPSVQVPGRPAGRMTVGAMRNADDNYPGAFGGRNSMAGQSAYSGHGSILPGQNSVYGQGSIYPGQEPAYDNAPETTASVGAPQKLAEVERPSYDPGPRATPNFNEPSNVIRDTLQHLPKLHSFSTGLQGPFEIDTAPLHDSRSTLRDSETPILGRSSQMTGSTVSVVGYCQCGNMLMMDAEYCRRCGKQREDYQVLVIKSGGNPIVRCGPPEIIGNRKGLQIRGADQRLWGTLKAYGRADSSDVYWYRVDPDYTAADVSGTRRPEIHIGQVDDGCGTLKVCIWDPVSENLPRGKPPSIERANELMLAQASLSGDRFQVHLAPINDEGWLKVLMLSLLLSVHLFKELRVGADFSQSGMIGL